MSPQGNMQAVTQCTDQTVDAQNVRGGEKAFDSLPELGDRGQRVGESCCTLDV